MLVLFAVSFIIQRLGISETCVVDNNILIFLRGHQQVVSLAMNQA
jgi:hypothetical protein